MVSHSPKHPFETVAVDYMGPYENDSRGRQYILVITDVIKKWTEAFATKNSKANQTLSHMEEVFSRFGYTRVVITDKIPDYLSV